MRKLYTLGMLTILLSFLASPVLADLQDCEDERNDNNLSKGLYGLCVAYWTVENENARDRILENFRRKAGDTPMPGTETKKPEEVTCPCWTIDDMASANIVADPFECQLNIDPVLAVYGEAGLAYFSINLFGPNSCFYVGPSAMRSEFDLSAEKEQACRDGIQALVDEDFQDITCT